MVMKLTTLLLVIGLVQASATCYSQVWLSEKNVSLEKVLNSIEKQTGTNFFYNRKDIKEIKISINVNNATLKEALAKCLDDLPFTYDIQENTVFLSKKSPSFIEKVIAAFTNIDVRGRVIDEKGEPLSGATIMVKLPGNSTMITVTDSKGQFTLKQVVDKAIIQIRMIGFEPKEIKAKQDLGDIILEVGVSKLDEVRVIAYGADTKRFSVGSVTTVNAADIQKQPVNNVLLALEGQVPGLLVTPSSGAPGAAVKLQIRGQNTMVQGVGQKVYDQPLIIVDGVPLSTQNGSINLLGSLGSQLNADTYGYVGGQSPFGTINPADIETISVLKDADATSIYGSQGSNGVILITTKKGKPGKTNLDISLNNGVEIATKQVQMLNTEQYVALRREAFANDGITTLQGTSATTAGYAPDLTIFDQNKNTDWFKYLMGSTSSTTNVNASVSGGTPNSTFMVSTGYTHEGYNFPGDFADNKLTLHTNFQFTSTDKKLNISFGSDFGYDRNNSSAVSTLTRNILTPPNFPDLIDGQGNLVWTYKGYDLSKYQTYGALKQPNLMQAYNLNEAFQLSYQIIPGLKFSTNLGYSRFNTVETQQVPLSSQEPSSSTTSSSTFGNSTYQTVIIEPQLNYKHAFKRGELTALFGGSYKNNLNNSTVIKGSGYSSDALLGTIASAGTVTISSDIANAYKYVAAFGRLGYIYDQKYIISITGRRDGSSNFGPGRQFGNFGSLGLGWIFSQEEGFKSILPFVSYAKLSANYGSAGSDAIAPYKYQAFWQAIINSNTFQGIRPLQPVNLFNPYYSWDIKKSLNAALDLGFFHDKILLNATWYRNRSSNQLLSYPLPNQTGFTSVIANSPATVQNAGLEITITSTNISTPKFKWSTNFNISGNRNTLQSFPGLATSSYASSYNIGQSINTVYGYRYMDVNPQTGVFEFYNAAGNATYSPKSGQIANGGDQVAISNPDPTFFGALGNTFTYKNISLSFLLQFTKQTGLNYLGSLYGNTNAVIPGGLINLPVAALSRWQQPGDISDIQKLTASNSAVFSPSVLYFSSSSGAYSDASYIRMKNVSLSYSLPLSLTKKLHVKSGRLYVNAENLFIITGYKVGDPESAGGLFTFPLQRTISGGISFNL